MIHKEGYWSVFVGILISVLLYFLVMDVFPNNNIARNLILLIDLIFLIFLVQFFRNPPRKILEIQNGILSPADGKIVVIERVLEGEFINMEMTQVSIFMSPFNIHKNLNPINGYIRKIQYHPGKFLVAFNPKSSIENERCSFLYETENKDFIVMRQIAGAVARRIVNYLLPDKKVKAGDEMGFIKFGSRVDLFIPTQYKILVNLADKVKGGRNLIAMETDNIPK